MNKEKKAIFDAALDEAKKLKIGNYHTEFIAYMNKKRKSLKIDKFKSLEALEEALDGSAKVPEDIFNGKPVANIVETLAENIKKNIDMDEDADA